MGFRLFWVCLFVLMASGVSFAQHVNLAVYNYSKERIVVLHNYVDIGIMEPGDYRGFTIPWDETQTFDFYRYSTGNINRAYRVQTYVGKFREYAEIQVQDKDLP